jgi:hypothetical protein
MPKITSFQWWFANDKNAWQEGAFWNISWLEYRKNVAYLELSKWVNDIFTISSWNGIPICLTTWGNVWIAWRDIVAITNTGKVIWYSTVHSTTPSAGAVNAFEVWWQRYILWTNKLHKLSSGSLSTYDSDIIVWAWPWTTMSVTTNYRPVLNWFWDILIGNGSSVSRFAEPYASIVEYSPWVTNWCIGWLDWTVIALTQVGTNVYVWCNNGSNTNLYIWNWESERPSEAIKYTDIPVMNVALLGNRHYWWSKKSQQWVRTVNIWESYVPQTYIKTTYPLYPLSTNTGADENRMIIHTDNGSFINALETLNDLVYLPWIWSIYSFGQYFPWVWKYSLWREIVFNGTYVTAMVSWWSTTSWRDFSGMLWFSYDNWSGYTIALYNSWQYWENPWVSYRSSGTYESMQFIAHDMYKWENDIKIIVPCYIPHSSCIIKVYEKRDEAWAYTEIKTIWIDDINNGNWGFDVIEISSQWKWRTKQLKFELITSNSSYSPRLYIWIDNQTEQVWNMTRR